MGSVAGSSRSRKVRAGLAAALLALGVGIGIWLVQRGAERRASGPLRHEVYVWQRTWTEAVSASVSQNTQKFGRVVVLLGEVSWEGGRPVLTQAEADWGLLRDKPVGIALRIGSYSGPFDEDAPATRSLVDVCAGLLRHVRQQGIAPQEFQIDFDCAESKLAGDRIWLAAIRREMGDTPLTITALPAWTKRREFAELVRSTDGYVMQVHSFERPRNSAASLQLCDPELAKQAVERCGRLGVPFRVALPTYGYVAGFGKDGKLLGLSAEGPAVTWPADATLREVRAEAAAMAGLVRHWTADRPAAMTGIIWYRLPNEQDVLNWRMVTLDAVMAGREPKPVVRVEQRSPEPGLIEVELTNAGDADGELARSVTITWDRTPLLASDGVGDYSREAETGRVRFALAGQSRLLAPGARVAVGWLRFESATTVQATAE